MIRFATARTSRAMLVAALLFGACTDDSSRRDPDLDTVGVQLTGTWDITLTLDRRLSLLMDASTLPRSASGTLVLLANHDGRLRFAELTDITHVGTYDIDLGSLGFPAAEAGNLPGVAVRTAGIPGQSHSGRHRDSLAILLNPESVRHMLRLKGTFDGERGSGDWISDAYLGGGGTFIIRRRSAADGM